MIEARRKLLGLALLGTLHPLVHARASARVTPAHATALPAALQAQLTRELAAIAADPACELASLSVLAIRAGRVSYAGQFGRRFIGVDALPDQPVDLDTKFRIASVSKMMTTLGLLRLVEAGRLDLDADVSRYLGWRLRNPHFPDAPILLRHLLTHTSSLRDDGGYSFGVGTALRDVLVAGDGDGKAWAANAAPGAYFTYCNLGFGLAGTIMEAVSGERFDRLMARLLLAPLGLHAGYHPAELSAADLAQLATLYRKRTVDTEIWDPAGPWIAQADDVHRTPPAPPAGIERYAIGVNATPFSPTGGLRISAPDLGIIMRMLMNDGVHDGRRILDKKTLDAMFTRQWTDDGRNGDTAGGLLNAWGIGNEQFPDHGPGSLRLVEGSAFDAVGHLGDAYGLLSAFVMDRRRRNGMVVLVGGTSTDPFSSANKGRYSALARFQERLLTALYRRAILVQT